MNNYHHEDLRSELIENGLVLIREEGVDKLSLRKLARICNVSEAAPYSHFKNKEHMINEMQRYVTDKLYDSLVEAYDSSQDKTSPRCIYNIGVAYVLFAIQQPDYFRFIFSQPCAHIDLSMESDNDFKPFQFYKEKSYEIYKALGFSDEKIKFGVIGMWAQVHGIATIASMEYVKTDFMWKDVLDKIVIKEG